MAYALDATINYAQSPVALSTVTLGTYTQAAAGTRWVWPFVLIVVSIAFLLEWLYGKRPAS
jgi:hypothetical protein